MRIAVYTLRPRIFNGKLAFIPPKHITTPASCCESPIRIGRLCTTVFTCLKERPDRTHKGFDKPVERPPVRDVHPMRRTHNGLLVREVDPIRKLFNVVAIHAGTFSPAISNVLHLTLVARPGVYAGNESRNCFGSVVALSVAIVRKLGGLFCQAPGMLTEST